ncbi:hypothetical protein N9M11_03325 [Flavobacteriaceae bacterium]|uniref:hypothetical protein n=1 Tax=Candidatus Arcticimaribacter forsetii TaxID=2820661 RepID=UPI002076D9B9|nr:hypothetical protein [Candidatus Arcticimaribacter forsetii]MDA8699133.1 hypothetical protein [Flavobacteriaceae bacterium]MDB2328917.1 hypothetical protein [Flavobacteriaceae bacterium]MDB2345215.1 hypothetical protein [Flavobacteriaceae bacterium]MDB4620527.1 hypothetical protein [Flavobacteriaceae bacterium]
MKFRLIMSGTCFDGSAHILSNDEVLKINNFKTKNDYSSLEEMYSELSTILGEENYIADLLTNYWINKTSISNSSLNFILLDGNDNLIWRSQEILNLIDTPWDEKVPDEIYEHIDTPVLESYIPSGNPECDAYPCDKRPNILFYYQELKGTLISYSIESDTEPKPEEFSHTCITLETPNEEIELVNNVLYKTQILQREYEYEDFRGKNLTVKLFTLKDV